MYKIRDFFQSVLRVDSAEIPSDEITCRETDTELTFYTNRMKDTLAAYTYTLVERGWLNLIYNGRSLALKRGDLYIYSPGFQVTIVSGSEDYHALCLMADESMTLERTNVRDIIRTAYLPIAEWGQPVVSMPEEYFNRLRNRMREVIQYQSSPHRFRTEVLRTLYALFLLDLTDIQEQTIGTPHNSERTTELFINFMRLLPKHFAEHHDIGFYADRLNITTTHLSRIVKQASGLTVNTCINQLLASEAAYLLTSTTLSVAQIADRLHFASTSSFDKFFMRMKGVSPKEYRRKTLFLSRISNSTS